MSYFLWGTTPDDQLLEAARSGALARPDGFETSARRLIDDRRSRPAVLAFFRQWLGTDGFLFTNKDAAVYPGFDEAVRKAMVEEQDAFVSHAVFEGTGKFEELFNADYVFASLPLARFYGLAGRRGDCPEDPRPDHAAGGPPRAACCSWAACWACTPTPTSRRPSGAASSCARA